MDDNAVQTAEDLAAALEAVRAVAPGERPGGVQVNRDSFNSSSGEGVRPRHAVDALENADDFQLLEYQDSRMFIATKLMNIGASPFVLMVVGAGIERDWQITSAYRLYEDDAADLARDACSAFQRFLLKFGLHFRANDRWVLFVPAMTAQPDAAGNLNLVELRDTDGQRSWAMSASTRVNQDGTASIAWPFAVDLTQYKAELKRRR